MAADPVAWAGPCPAERADRDLWISSARDLAEVGGRWGAKCRSGLCAGRSAVVGSSRPICPARRRRRARLADLGAPWPGQPAPPYTSRRPHVRGVRAWPPPSTARMRTGADRLLIFSCYDPRPTPRAACRAAEPVLAITISGLASCGRPGSRAPRTSSATAPVLQPRVRCSPPAQRDPPVRSAAWMPSWGALRLEVSPQRRGLRGALRARLLAQAFARWVSTAAAARTAYEAPPPRGRAHSAGAREPRHSSHLRRRLPAVFSAGRTIAFPSSLPAPEWVVDLAAGTRSAADRDGDSVNVAERTSVALAPGHPGARRRNARSR